MRKYSLFVCMLGVLLFVSCDSKESKNAFQDNTEEGTIRISVDESFKPVIEEQLKVHQSSYPKANIIASYKSEADCFRDLQNNSTRMIIVARGLDEKEAEYYKSILSYPPQYAELAYDAVALIVNNNAADSIFSFQDVKDILSGKHKITAVMDGKSATSTVRYLKDSVLKGGNFGANVVAANNSKEVIEIVTSRTDVIGFVGMSWIGDVYDKQQQSYLTKIRLARVECTACLEKGIFAKPSQSTITYGQYPLARPLFYVLKENHAGLGTGFMNFMSLERGQLIFRRSFLAPAKMAFHKRQGSIKSE
ncbi:substrate-binding domain-containing protein [Sediminibacterium sp.]|uniref:PstS family phosphate ABC transporter substrate-binding protein n=1 Tax=Sediminibacterium sp. TaxID=1917865 RepID=UPI0025D37C83|nr:substrate-binding domain-containing protein [Sediminibacterium sp.]MBT9484636.1 substrate-binding domain-containing protein [Sediminibacterium sp.]